MKVERKIFKGIEYVLFTELPQPQRENILQTLSKDHFIKILIEGTIISQCLQYKDYSFWFDSVYNTKPLHVKEKVTETVILSSPALALKA
jgi:hypothetical protein